MFNGIIFNNGKVNKVLKRSKGINIFLKTDLKLNNKDIGISVACDGVCLTLISIKNKLLEFYLSNETIVRSNFKNIKIGKILNLELPLKYKQKISGHICQGHVDCVGKVLSIKRVDRSYQFRFSIPSTFKRDLIAKASISINGISLTISKILSNSFEIWVIPHTYKLTNLSNLKRNSLVNIEIDILSKYVKNYLNDKK